LQQQKVVEMYSGKRLTLMSKPLNFVIASVLWQVPKRTVLPYSPAALPIT